MLGPEHGPNGDAHTATTHEHGGKESESSHPNPRMGRPLATALATANGSAGLMLLCIRMLAVHHSGVLVLLVDGLSLFSLVVSCCVCGE